MGHRKLSLDKADYVELYRLTLEKAVIMGKFIRNTKMKNRTKQIKSNCCKENEIEIKNLKEKISQLEEENELEKREREDLKVKYDSMKAKTEILEYMDLNALSSLENELHNSIKLISEYKNKVRQIKHKSKIYLFFFLTNFYFSWFWNLRKTLKKWREP